MGKVIADCVNDGWFDGNARVACCCWLCARIDWSEGEGVSERRRSLAVGRFRLRFVPSRVLEGGALRFVAGVGEGGWGESAKEVCWCVVGIEKGDEISRGVLCRLGWWWMSCGGL